MLEAPDADDAPEPAGFPPTTDRLPCGAPFALAAATESAEAMLFEAGATAMALEGVLVAAVAAAAVVGFELGEEAGDGEDAPATTWPGS